MNSRSWRLATSTFNVLLALSLGATAAHSATDETGSEDEHEHAATGPEIELASDPDHVVLEVWIGGGMIDQPTQILVYAGGYVRIANPNRLSADQGTYAMDISASELQALLRALADAGLFEATRAEIGHLIGSLRTASGDPISISDNLNLLVSSSLSSFRHSIHAEPIFNLEHTVLLPHPGFWAERFPENERLKLLAKAVSSLIALTKDERLKRVSG